MFDLLDYMIAPYCAECGAKCTHLFTGRYDPDNGKPDWIYACPTHEKNHHGMDDCRLWRRDVEQQAKERKPE